MFKRFLVILFFCSFSLNSTSVLLNILVNDLWFNVVVSRNLPLFESSVEIADLFVPSLSDLNKIVFVFHQGEVEMVIRQNRKPVVVVDLLSDDVKSSMNSQAKLIFDQAVLEIIKNDNLRLSPDDYYFKILNFLKILKICLLAPKQKKVSFNNWFYKLCG